MPYKDRAEYLASQKKLYQIRKEERKWCDLKNKYGLTKEEYTNLLESQGKSCALCSKLFEGIHDRRIHIDHCHSSNKVRGILCMPCNVALGMLGDNEEGLTKALNYVKGIS